MEPVFEPVAEIVSRESSGEPVASQREPVRRSLLRGLSDVSAGRVSRRDDYLDGVDVDE